VASSSLSVLCTVAASLLSCVALVTVCHAVVPGGTGRQGEEIACAECHPDNAVSSHPVGVVPSMAVPDDLPLDAAGRVVCSTCHRDHGEIVPTGDGRRSLRRSNIPTLCRSCHRFEEVINHRGNLPFAHALDRPGRAVDERGIDHRSIQCLGCHDALHPMIGGEEIRQARLFGNGSGTISHPIGVELASNSHLSGGPLEWRPVLDPRIRLLGGRVGCPSCHDPFSTRSNKLVVDNHGSRLCLGCHGI